MAYRTKLKDLDPELHLKKIQKADWAGTFGGTYEVYRGKTLLGTVYEASAYGWSAELPSGTILGRGYAAYESRLEAIAALV